MSRRFFLFALLALFGWRPKPKRKMRFMAELKMATKPVQGWSMPIIYAKES